MNRRIEQRFQVYSPARVVLLDDPERELVCSLTDISAAGVRLLADENLRPDGMIAVEAEGHLVLCDVRHCQRRGNRFAVGAEKVHTLSTLDLLPGLTMVEKIQSLINDYHLRLRTELTSPKPELPVASPVEELMMVGDEPTVEPETPQTLEPLPTEALPYIPPKALPALPRAPLPASASFAGIFPVLPEPQPAPMVQAVVEPEPVIAITEQPIESIPAPIPVAEIEAVAELEVCTPAVEPELVIAVSEPTDEAILEPIAELVVCEAAPLTETKAPASTVEPEPAIALPEMAALANWTGVSREHKRVMRTWSIVIGIMAGLVIVGAEVLFYGPFRVHAEMSPPPVRIEQPAPPVVVEEVPPVATVATPSNHTRHASLAVTQNSWITACVDGQWTLSKLLVPSEKQEIQYSKIAMLRLGNAGAVQMTMDGKPAGSLGDPGMVTVVQLTPDGFSLLPASTGAAACLTATAH